MEPAPESAVVTMMVRKPVPVTMVRGVLGVHVAAIPDGIVNNVIMAILNMNVVVAEVAVLGWSQLPVRNRKPAMVGLLRVLRLVTTAVAVPLRRRVVLLLPM